MISFCVKVLILNHLIKKCLKSLTLNHLKTANFNFLSVRGWKVTQMMETIKGSCNWMQDLYTSITLRIVQSAFSEKISTSSCGISPKQHFSIRRTVCFEEIITSTLLLSFFLEYF